MRPFRVPKAARCLCVLVLYNIVRLSFCNFWWGSMIAVYTCFTPYRLSFFPRPLYVLRPSVLRREVNVCLLLCNVVLFNSERSEAEGRAESRELCWKRRKWMKKKNDDDDDVFCTPLFPLQIWKKVSIFEENFETQQKILDD